MASKIEWTDETWNPVVGCSIVSPGCTNCYAMKMAGRLEAIGVPHYAGTTAKTKAGFVWTGKMEPAPEHIRFQPLRWRRPRRIFVNSMSDLFADGVPRELIDQVFATMVLTPHHQHQILTKRAGAMRDYVRDLQTPEGLERLMMTWVDHPTGTHRLIELIDPAPVSRAFPNVWLGVSVESQLYAHSRRDFLRDVAELGWNTFVSYEPALGPVDWSGWEFLKWLIAGGESGADARPMHPDWARAARDFCAAHGILFFFKQWGAFKEAFHDEDGPKVDVVDADDDAADSIMALFARRETAFVSAAGVTFRGHHHNLPDDAAWRLMVRGPKGGNGRVLDGAEHNGMPEVVS